MKKIFTLISFTTFIIYSNAQEINFTDDFESNSLGWTEVVDKRGQALISEGVMQIESKGESYSTMAWTNLDPAAPFEIKVDVKVKKIDESRSFGILIDFLDLGNYIGLWVEEGNATVVRYKDDVRVGSISNSIKLAKAKKANVTLGVKYGLGKLIFEVNDIFALEARYIELTSSGVGLFVQGKQKLEFDNFTLIQ
jgi:hypothetical protein